MGLFINYVMQLREGRGKGKEEYSNILFHYEILFVDLKSNSALLIIKATIFENRFNPKNSRKLNISLLSFHAELVNFTSLIQPWWLGGRAVD